MRGKGSSARIGRRVGAGGGEGRRGSFTGVAAPCVDVVMGLVAKARAGLSDADFRAEVEVVLSGLAEMALTDDEVLVEALWDAGVQAYRAGWVANGDDVAGSKRNCHKPPGEPCREHGGLPCVYLSAKRLLC